MTAPVKLIALPPTTAAAEPRVDGGAANMERHPSPVAPPDVTVTRLRILTPSTTQHHPLANEPEIAVLPLPPSQRVHHSSATARRPQSAGQWHHHWARRQQRTIIAAALAVGAVMGASLYYSGSDETTSATEITVQPAAPK